MEERGSWRDLGSLVLGVWLDTPLGTQGEIRQITQPLMGGLALSVTSSK